MRDVKIKINDDGYASSYEKFIGIQNENEATRLVFDLPDIYKKDGSYQYVAFTLPDGTIKVRRLVDYTCIIDSEITSQRGVILISVIIKSVENVLDIETGYIMSSQPISGYIKKTILEETGTNSIDKNVRIYLDEFDALLMEIRSTDERLASILDSDPSTYAEVIDARGGYTVLKNRLDAMLSSINTNYNNIKSNSREIEVNHNYIVSNYSTLLTKINALASGSPKGTYTDSAALKAANPDTGVYIATSNGHIYSWTKNQSGNPIDLGVYQATGIEDGGITTDKLANKSVTLDKIDFESYLFTNYTVEHKYLTGISISQHKPTWSRESSDYYGVDFEIPASVDYLIYPYTNVGNFGAVGYNETSNQYGYTNQNIINNAYSEFNYNDSANEVKINLNALRTKWTRIALNLSPNKHNIRFITKDGSNIVIPLTKFIGKDNIKDGAISLEKCDNNLKELINGSSKQIITVKQDGTGDFTTLNSALASLVSGNKYEIQIYEGTYNVSDYWTEEQLNNANYPNGFYGEVVPDGCDLVGIGDRDNIIIHAELPTSYNWNTIRNQISTLNILGNSTLKNITITTKGLRYAIHDDFSSSENTTHNYINCKMIYESGFRDAFGSGARNGQIINIEDCEIEPSIGYHTNVRFTIKPILNIKNTIIEGELKLTDYNSGIDCPVNLENVKYSYMTYSKFNNTTQYIKVNSFGNSISPIINTTDFNFNGEETIKCLAVNAVLRGQPVKRVDSSKIAPMTSTDDSSLFYGVAIENISQYVYNSNRYFGNVQTKGYINTQLIGLSEFAVGNKIGIVNGVFGIVNENAIGIIEFAVDGVGYIRLFK